MTISFVCPQGHPLTAPDEMAGKASKCPHCQTRFLVPQLELDEPEPPQAPTPPAIPPAPRAESITFICPNGHKLSGPSTLRGKLGLCPHCQSRFRIPLSDETSGIVTVPAGHDSLSSSGSTEISQMPAFAAGPPSGIAKKPSPATSKSSASVSFAPPPPAPPPPPPAPPAPAATPQHIVTSSKTTVSKAAPFIDEVPPAEIIDDFTDVPAADDTAPGASDAPPAEIIGAWQTEPPAAPAASSRWFQLFGWFWSQRDARSVVDLRLKGGQVFQPAWFAPSLSDAQFGVFGTQSDDGTYDISIIAWDQVERVDVRGCEDLPPGRFE